jgi:DNA-binding IclR family transcriptional regulator
MTDPPDWMRSVDQDILAALERAQPEYIPLLANRLGLHLSYVERRCDRLADHGFIEPVSDEVVYRLTPRGESFLASERDAE